jgi:hypothetical protein
MANLVIKFWYPEIVEDIDKIVDAIEYYRTVLFDGQQHLTMKGWLEKLLQEQAGLLRIYEDAHTDCSMVHKWLEEHIKFERAKKKLWYISADGKAEYGDLKKTDVDLYVQCDPEIKNLIDLQLMIELWKEALGTLVERLKKRGIYLSMITKIRISGEREVFIDANHETNPETLR